MKQLFTIGEISKIFNIPAATLRYYDSLGLFKPAYKDEQTSYRYYSIDQFEKLSNIRYLRQMGVPLQETKNINEKMTPESYLQLLKKQHDKAVQEYNRLQKVITKFTRRIDEIEKARQCRELDVVRLESIGERKIFRLQERITSRSELEVAIRKLEKKSGTIVEKVGLTIALADLLSHRFNDYNSIFVLAEESVNQQHTKMLDVLPAGEYACIYYRAKHDESAPYYEKLLKHLEAINYFASGDALRFIIIDRIISSDRDKYLAELQVPVKKDI